MFSLLQVEVAEDKGGKGRKRKADASLAKGEFINKKRFLDIIR